MDELIVRIARTVACMPRLRVLAAVSRVDEVAPSEVARRLGMSRHLVSAHLLRLSAVALIQRRRSGAWHYCRAGSVYGQDALSGQLALWLTETLGDPTRGKKDRGVQQLRHPFPQARDPQLHRAIFDAATAFTSVRRLQILPRLAAAPADSAMLCRELSMSHSAAARHTAKLIRRGYVVAPRTGRRVAYRLAQTFSTPLHARLFEIISSHWSAGPRGAVGTRRRRKGRA